jgi:hypothetical protein
VVIEAGHGKRPQDYLGISLHIFPSSKPAHEIMAGTGRSDSDITQSPYRVMLADM